MENINIEELNYMVSNFRLLLIFIVFFASIALFAFLNWIVYCVSETINNNLRPKYKSVKNELEDYKRQYQDLSIVDTKHIYRICALEKEIQELKKKNGKRNR